MPTLTLDMFLRQLGSSMASDQSKGSSRNGTERQCVSPTACRESGYELACLRFIWVKICPMCDVPRESKRQNFCLDNAHNNLLACAAENNVSNKP